jgi:hypothetical protein
VKYWSLLATPNSVCSEQWYGLQQQSRENFTFPYCQVLSEAEVVVSQRQEHIKTASNNDREEEWRKVSAYNSQKEKVAGGIAKV